MSLASIVGRVEGAADILFGSAAPVTLGTFEFTNFEVPEQMPWGGAQKLNVHKMPGGARVIDNMGRDDHAITWAGVFLGSDHASRAAALNSLRLQGQPLPLAWGPHFRTVVISDFSPVTVGPGRTNYSITVEILYVVQGAQTPTLLGSILADVSTAVGFNVQDALGQASQALATASTAVSAVTVLTGGSSAALGVLGTLSSTSATLAGVAGTADGSVTAIGGGGPGLLGTSNGTTAATNLASLAGATGIMANARAAAAYVGRAVSNVGNALP